MTHSQVNATATKVGMAMAHLKPAMPYMSKKRKKEIVNSKVKPIALYGSHLMLGQSQQIIHNPETILMRINHWMTSNPEGLRSKNALCHYLDIDTPRPEIVKSNFILMHKMIRSKMPEKILSHLILPRRSSGKMHIRGIFYTERAKSHLWQQEF